MKKRAKPTDILDWEELEEAPNTRGAFSFLRPQSTVINIGDHRSLEVTTADPREAQDRQLAEKAVSTGDVLSSGDFLSTVDDMSILGQATLENVNADSFRTRAKRPYREHRCFRVQDAHSPGENQLFAALHNAARPDGEDRRITIGWTRMAALAGLSDKAVKRLTRSLIDKLALDLVAPENSATKTVRTYRVYSFANILKRRNAAGLQWVIKDKGVRFVSKDLSVTGGVGGEPLCSITSTVDIKSSEAVDITYPLTRDKLDTVKGDIPSTPLRSGLGNKKEETTTTEDLALIVEAFSSYAVADEDLAKRIVRGARSYCVDASVSEIVAVIHLKAPEIVRNRSVRNPLGLLTHSIPLCFQGSGIIRLRKAWAAEREREVLRQAEREERDREMKQWIGRQVSEWKEVLANPAATDKERENAKRHILQFGPEIPGYE